jgi:hypothetical protein
MNTMAKAAKTTPFEAFVQKILAVPKDAIQEAEAQRIRRAKPRRFRIKAKK